MCSEKELKTAVKSLQQKTKHEKFIKDKAEMH